MLLAVDYGSNLYDLVLLGHLLCVIVGFGSTFVWPVLAMRAQKSGDPVLQAKVSEMSLGASEKLSEWFIYGAGAFGLLLVILGATADPTYWEFSEPWISIAMGLYIVGLVISKGLHYPNLKRMDALAAELASGTVKGTADGPPTQVAELAARGKKAAMFGGILHLIFAIILLDMVFKPF